MRQFIYYLSLAGMFFGICFAVLCIPAFILDTEITTMWQGIALATTFFIIYIVKPYLKKALNIKDSGNTAD